MVRARYVISSGRKKRSANFQSVVPYWSSNGPCMGGQAGGVRHGVAGERSSRGFIWSDRKHRRFTAERGADFMDNAGYRRAEESGIEQGPIAASGRRDRVGGKPGCGKN